MSTTEFETLLARAEAAFGEAAVQAHLVDVATALVDSPVGPLLVAATDVGIVHLGFDEEESLATLAACVSPRILAVPRRLDAARGQLDEYFAGHRTGFDLPLDLRLVRGPFRREVVQLLPSIPIGTTLTYTQLASTAGRPNAVRAVGTSCATNPVPIIIPCHRVLRTDGALGGYLGGVARKQWLLDHEQRVAG